ncbi:hypothetical protein N7466_007405 [Penicillium verhagenii]|uniref:uncharacterized protein n=1 Tax=Penicillium verhagenii TaxID=1562060 RepID=UPI0025451417|nr:uncharacterized protein N7466_007405 [Penicillium verhagenii]KAJ5928449.1 hypothetical protein N7466_007405 [Penicillium verhagenii]
MVLSRCTRCNIFKLAYSKTHGVLFDPDFQTPLILGESLDFSDSEESQFVGAFSDGLWAKSESILSMSGFQKPAAGSVLDYASTRSLHDASSFSAYGQSPYVPTSLVPSPMADQASQISDCVPYMPGNEYGSSYEESQSPLMNARSRQIPEIYSYSPQRGCEGTRVVVEIQSPYDLHSSAYGTVYVVFGSQKCECLPNFLGFEGSNFRYALAADAPQFISTASPSFAVPVQVVMEGQSDCPPATLQVGVYTYEHVPQSVPSTSSHKRKFSSYSDHPIAASVKRSTGPIIPKIEPQDNYSYRDTQSHNHTRSSSFSPYVQSLPAIPGFVGSYHGVSSPRTGTAQYPTVSATPQSVLRAPSPLTPAWSPSFVSLGHDGRSSSMAIPHTMTQRRGPSPAGSATPQLIRTSTLQQSSGVGHSSGFNPWGMGMYPNKANLKLSGDLDSMAHGWSKDEQTAQRRLVQFGRTQTGSTIHADFKPVTPEERIPNSICISCISWEGKDECYVTSVDTIYLLESLVNVRFTVEEKNRIRRNLEGFRPLTVSKAKADSEEFFKVIMGFPAPKPRNIEKDVKVFPWRILSLALKKIIGKYSASYSSTAGIIQTPATNYASHGTGSDSGTEPHTAPSPHSVSDSGPVNHYAPAMSAPVYSTQPDHCASLTAAPDLRSVMPTVTQPYTTMGMAGYSYPAICQPHSTHGLVAPTPRSAWEMHGLGAPPPSTAASAGACYTYMDPVYHPLHDTTAPGP